MATTQPAKYRISQIQIEGFRGFTAPQTLALDGKHLFLFGPNGKGKSSVLEAVRWCLFGAKEGRKEIEVRNLFYSTTCSVTLKLDGHGGPIFLQRVLKPGHDHSRPTVRNASGKEVAIKEALPQLSRLGQEAGAQVIFSAQHSGSRHIPVNMDAFAPAFEFYLHLDGAGELLRALDDVYERRKDEFERLSSQTEQAVHRYREQLRIVKQRLEKVLESPPWDGAIPTGLETNHKIKSFISDLARLYGQNMPQEPEPARNLLQLGERWLSASSPLFDEKLAERHVSLLRTVELAERDLNNVHTQTSTIAAIDLQAQDLKQRHAELLAGTDLGSTQQQVARLESEQTEFEARQAVARAAKMFIDCYNTGVCPACGTKMGTSALHDAVASQCLVDEELSERSHALDALRSHLVEVTAVDNALDMLEKQSKDSKTAVEHSFRHLKALLSVDGSIELAEIKLLVGNMRSDIARIERTIEDAKAERAHQKRILRALQQEYQYQEDRDLAVMLQTQLSEGMEDAQPLLADYADLLQATYELRSVIAQAYDEAFDRALPALNDMLTQVYRDLTAQPSFDVVRVHRRDNKPDGLQVRVGSTALPGETFPSNVLNGQAEKALQIVPYLVFSRFQPEILELDLLLIDDPSQSFDTSHVDLLLRQLSDAGQHAQIVVASHEQEKFELPLSRAFDTASYTVVTVNEFSRINGPAICPG